MCYGNRVRGGDVTKFSRTHLGTIDKFARRNLQEEPSYKYYD
jgi:hypothetical protein